MTKTPVTRKGLQQYDKMLPADAAMLAWGNAGEHPEYHRKMKEEVRRAMPLLARALDRMVK